MLDYCRKIFVVCILITLSTLGLYAQDYTTKTYIEKHSPAAQTLMRETGVPASVILAVAIHESAYGNSRIARYLNNHFGIKGKNSSKKIRSAYKGYGSVLDSYRDFVGLLQRRKATRPLFDKHNSEDYKGWVKGIAKSGYSETGDWSRKVISTINTYDLEKYDEKINLN
ncbi:glucosaminidase domain-containing protein [Sphingobacterium sp. WM]|uniref:glycoside hydrolase family 73 protein n=1 Tax=Sphingobacterium sp. WM TaxID=3031802 RepID=UPI00240D8BF7|nr:glucosaminidase domain-containing protein [Sphingobacterium sp. WM]WFB63571.1 glucosaminidase domain-containing protein [Sphingobacterium sp. WM]